MSEKIIEVLGSKKSDLKYSTCSRIPQSLEGVTEATAIYGENGFSVSIGDNKFTIPAPAIEGEIETGIDWATFLNAMQNKIIENSIPINFPFYVYAS